MKYAEIKGLKVEELQKRLSQTRQALFDARMKHKMQRLSNIMELRTFKKDIAHLETALSSLPASAFVSDKKESVKKEEVKKNLSVKKVAVKKVKKTEPLKEAKTSVEKKVSSVAKVDEEKTPSQKKVLSTTKTKDLHKQDKQDKKQKTHKWFGFFGQKNQQKQDAKSTGKRTMFRRKGK